MVAHPTLDDLQAERNRLRAESTKLRAFLVQGVSASVPGTPVTLEVYTAVKRLVRASAELQDVEKAIASIH